MGMLKLLIDRGIREEGYLEKASKDSLDSKTANRGTGNYTKYSRDVDTWGLMGCQGQPWCNTFQFWLEGKEYGVNEALRHWNMDKNAYTGYNCFATYNAFKRAGRTGMTPQVGAVAIFNFSHSGRVIRIYSEHGKKWWDSLEGNTSSNQSDRNGGQVKIKKRPWKDSSVKGFCYIDYKIQAPAGWVKDGEKYWYRLEDGSYPADKWMLINHHWYLFGKDGYMVTGWAKWNGGTIVGDQDPGHWYFFHNIAGSPLEGACWHEAPGNFGGLEPWYVEGK